MTIQSVTNPPEVDQEKSSLRLIKVEPVAGSILNQNSILEADLEYRVKDFVPGQYEIIAQFSLSQAGRSTDGDFPQSDYPILTSPAGRVHFCYSIAYVWNRPVQIPFDLRFFLNRMQPDMRSSKVVAQTEHLQFPVSK